MYTDPDRALVRLTTPLKILKCDCVPSVFLQNCPKFRIFTLFVQNEKLPVEIPRLVNPSVLV